MPMADIVASLIRNGWMDDDIAKELGMDADEVLRFKQNIGLPELFNPNKPRINLRQSFPQKRPMVQQPPHPTGTPHATANTAPS
jgi:hypothetical protein